MLLWLLTGLGGGLMAQENIAVWKFNGNTTVTCVSDLINASDCDFTSEGTVNTTGTNSPNSVLCGEDPTGAKSLQVSGQGGGSVVFKISTLPFVGLGVSYDLRCHPNMTNHGYSTYTWSYSLNGTDFTVIPSATISNFTETTFQSQTADFSSISALCGRNAVWFKLTMSGNDETAMVASNLDNVVFTGEEANCVPPTNLTVSNVSTTGATISWTPGDGTNETSYKVYLTASSTTAPGETSGTQVNGTSKTYTGLTSGTTYYVYIKANCEDNISSIWTMTSFTTCSAPTNVNVSNITGVSATVTWTDAVNTSWQVCVTTASTPDWTGAAVTNVASYSATGLTLNTAYNVFVRPYCDGCACLDATDVIASSSFRTAFAENATEVVVGDGTSESYYSPMCTWFAYSWTQMVYTADQIGYAGTIGELAFYVSTAHSVTPSPINIYMGVATMAENTSTTSWLSMSDLTLVYSSTNRAIGANTGWETYTLDTPFEYDGSGSLIIVVAKSISSYTSSLEYRYTSTTNAVMYRGDDSNTSYAQHPGTNSGTRSNKLPNIRLAMGNPHAICRDVTAMAASNIATNSATVTWTAGSEETAWLVKYGPTGFNVATEGTELNVTETSASLTGLSASTIYDVYVKAICDAENNYESGWAKLSFATLCDAIDLPYENNFDSYTATTSSTQGVMPLCWDIVWNGTAAYGPHVSTAAAINTQGLLMNANSANSSIAIMPLFNGDLSTAIVAFDTKRNYTTYGTLNFGYYLNGEFTNIQQLNTTTTVTHHEIDMSNESALPEGARLAFQYTSTYSSLSSYYINIDNLTIFRPASCGYITEVITRDITNNSAVAAWSTHGTATQWEVSCNGVTTVVSDTAYTITGLDETTTYEFSVRTACGNDEYSDPETVSFTTMSAPATVPYTQDFENALENEKWFLVNGTQTNKWYIGTAANNGGANGLYVSNTSGTTNAYSTSNTSYTSAYRTISLPAAGDYAFSYDWKGQGESNYYDYSRAFLAPTSYQWTAGTVPSSTVSTYAFSSWTAPAGWIEITEEGSSPRTLAMNNSWHTVTGTFSVDAPAMYNLVFAWANDGSSGTNPPTAIDNISIIQLTCPEVANIIATNLTATSTTLTWTERGEATEWSVVLSGTAMTTAQLDAAASAVVTATSLAVDTLTPNTPYYVYVRANCSADDQSFWTAYEFSTPCTDYELPLSENFNTQNATTYYTAGVMPDCWDAVYYGSTVDYAPHVCNYTSYAPLSDNYLLMVSAVPAYSTSYGNNNVVILPGFDGGVANSRISFNFKHSSSNGHLILGYWLDGAFNQIAETPWPATETTEFSYIIPETVPAGARIALKDSTQDGMVYTGIDNIVIRRLVDDNTLLSYTASTEQGYAISAVNNETHTIAVELRSGYTAGENISQTVTPNDENATVKQQIGADFLDVPSAFTWDRTSADTTITYKVIAENGDEQLYTATFVVESCAAPSHLASEQTSATNVNLSWTAAEGTSSWNVYVATESMTMDQLNALAASDYTTVSTAATSIVVEPETTYFWYVRADCGASHSAWMNSLFTTWENCLAPSNFTAELVGESDIVLNWTAPSSLPSEYVNIVDDFERNSFADGPFSYTNNSAYAWSVTTASHHGGSKSIKSGNYNINSSTSSFQLTTNYPVEMTLSFWYSVSSESGYDKFYFSVDGTGVVNGVSGTISWTQCETTLAAGEHTLEWKYTKDVSSYTGSDCAYVDDITLSGEIVGAGSSVVLYRGADEIATLPMATTTYTDEDIEAGNTYCYTIQTICRENNISAQSEEACVSINDCYAVTNVTASDVAVNTATINWTRGTSETAWNIKVNGGTPIAIDETSEDVTVDGNNISYALTGLEAITNYTVAIQTNCGDALGAAWPSVDFTTEHAPATLPFICDFEDATQNDGWVLENGTQTNKWFVGTAARNGGSNGLYVSNNNGASNAYSTGDISYSFAYRTINFDHASDFIYSYDWKGVGESNNYDFSRAFLVPTTYSWNAGTIPGGTTYDFAHYAAPADWIEITEAFATPRTLAQSSSWRTATGNISIENAGLYNLVFAWANDGGGGTNPPTAIDNVRITEITCPAVGNLAASEITNNSATISWTERGGASSWEVVLSTSALSDAALASATATPVTDTFYNATELTAETLYHVYVRATCSTEDISTWTHATFNTVAACPEPTGLTTSTLTATSVTFSWEGYHATQWTFEYKLAADANYTVVENLTETNYTIATTSASTYMARVKAVCDGGDTDYTSVLTFTTPCEAVSEFPWSEGFESTTAPALPTCWSYIDANGDGDYWKTYASSGNPGNCVRIYTDNNSGNNNDYLILPPFVLDGTYVFSYDVKAHSTGEPNDYEVVLSTTGNLPENFTTVLQPLELVSSTSYSRREISLNDYHGQVYIAIHIPQNGADGWYLYLDNFAIRMVNNEADITAYTIETQTGPATIDADAATVDIEVSFGTDLSTLAPVVTVSDGATYEAGTATAVDAFTTTIPYVVTAEDGITTKDWLATITRATTASSAKDILTFTFTGQIGESVISTDDHTVNAVAPWNANLTNIRPHITVSDLATISPLSGLAQDFTAPVTYTVMAEDSTTQDWTVTIEHDPTACPNPTTLTVATVSETSATVVWNAAYLESSYRVLASASPITNFEIGPEVYDGTVNDTAVVLTGLSAETTYYVYVQSVCDSAEGWVQTSFYTGMCTPAPTSVDGSGITNVTFGTNQIVNNSTRLTSAPYYGNYATMIGDVQAGTTATVNITYQTGYTYGTVIWVNWNNDLVFSDDEVVYAGQSLSSNPTTLVATFEVPVDMPIGSYKMRIGGSDSHFDNQITAGSGYEPCYSGSYTVYHDYTLQVTEAPSCLPVVNLAASEITNNSATLAWTAGDGTAWDVVVSATALDDPETGDIVATTEAAYNVTGLNASTTYYAYVRSNCGNGDYSEWRNTTFTTQCGLVSLPYSETFDNESSLDCWTIIDANNDDNTWNFENLSSAVVYPYHSSNGGNDWLISPKLAIVNGAELTFDYFVYSSYYPERFSAYVITDLTNYAGGIQILATQEIDNEDPITIEPIDLSAYAGQEIYIGIKAESEADMDGLLIDNFSITIPEVTTYTITASAGENGTITPAGDVVVEAGADQAFTIAANDGYQIASVMVDGAEAIDQLVDGVYTFENVMADHTINATFEEIPAVTYTITATAGENGTITPNGDVTVAEGADQEFTIVANAGYQIVSVMVDDAEAVALLVDGVYTFTNVMADHTINATFEAIPPTTYTITANAGSNGTITPNGTITVNEGADQAFTITPNAGFQIDAVVVDGQPVTLTDADLAGYTYTFTNVTADHTINATFTTPANVFTITAVAGANGTITPNGTITVNAGEDKSFVVTPNAGFQIDFLVVDGQALTLGTADLAGYTYTFTNVTADHTINATFRVAEATEYIISATAGANGTITPNGDVTVAAGADQAFAITADAGYQIASVMVDGVEAIGQLENGVYTFRNVSANHSINATFQTISSTTYNIIATAGANGTITPNGIVEVYEGTNQTFTITPDEHYRIATVTVDGVNAIDDVIDFQYTFYNVTANHTIDVTFVDADAVELYEIGTISAYPNPNNGMFSIDFSSIEGEATFQLSDVKGAMIDSRDINVFDGDTMNFNYDLRPGTYFVRIITSDNVYVEQIVVR